MIEVAGKLVDPLNQPSIHTLIRVRALTTKVTIDGMVGQVYTDDAGDYVFSLVQGDHLIEVNFSNEFVLTGRVRVDENTPANLTLGALLTGHTIP